MRPWGLLLFNTPSTGKGQLYQDVWNFVSGKKSNRRLMMGLGNTMSEGFLMRLFSRSMV
jgi:hypothetical protein